MREGEGGRLAGFRKGRKDRTLACFRGRGDNLGG